MTKGKIPEYNLRPTSNRRRTRSVPRTRSTRDRSPLRTGLETPLPGRNPIAAAEITPGTATTNTDLSTSSVSTSAINNPNPRESTRAPQGTVTPTPMSALLLNPYDAVLDLNNKEDRKLFQDACKGLKDKDLFDGKRETYSDFAKLIERQFNTTRVMESLLIPTKWKDHASTTEEQREVEPSRVVDIFTSNKASREEVVTHCNMVWEDTRLGTSTLKFFQTFQTNPTTDDELDKERHKRRLKHVMMGQQIWNSLSSAFQIEMMPHKSEFQRNREYDGPLMWDFIRRRVKPSTTVGASKLKDDLEKKTINDFGNDVVKYNSWFVDTRAQIIREEGDGYSESLRSLFRAYRASPNAEFRDAIASEKRNWTQGKLPDTYSYLDLMDLARLEYNNAVEDETWDATKGKLESESRESNILALATQILGKVNLGRDTTAKDGDGNPTGGDGGKKFQPWRFENPNNDKTKLVRGTVMNWCSKDCHQQPMWCGRKRCLSKAEYAVAMNDKRNGTERKTPAVEGNGGRGISNDFKIALAALTTPEDFASLEQQFFSGKD